MGGSRGSNVVIAGVRARVRVRVAERVRARVRGWAGESAADVGR